MQLESIKFTYVLSTNRYSPPPFFFFSFLEAPRVTLVVAGQRLVELSWTVKPCSPTHPIKGYVVRLANKTGIYQVNSSGMACRVTDLKPYTEYNVSVRAIKEVGYGRWSNVTTTRTVMAGKVNFSYAGVLRVSNYLTVGVAKKFLLGVSTYP